MPGLAACRHALRIRGPQAPRVQRDPLRREIRMQPQAEGHRRVAQVDDGQGHAQAARVEPVALHAFERPGPAQHAGRLLQHQIDAVFGVVAHPPGLIEARAMDRMRPAGQRRQHVPGAVESEYTVPDAVGIGRKRIGPRARPLRRRPFGGGQRHDPIVPARGKARQAAAAIRRELGLVRAAGDGDAHAGVQRREYGEILHFCTAPAAITGPRAAIVPPASSGCKPPGRIVPRAVPDCAAAPKKTPAPDGGALSRSPARYNHGHEFSNATLRRRRPFGPHSHDAAIPPPEGGGRSFAAVLPHGRLL
ncbi:hypothetical protein D9M68_622630 [compost metagenome]